MRYGRALDAAGVASPLSRRGYRRAALSVLRTDPQHYVAIRLLIPGWMQPHLVAAYWFAQAADGIADGGAARDRLDRFDAWVRTAGPDSTRERPGTPPAAFWRTVETTGMPGRRVQNLLDGLRADAAAATQVLDEDGLRRYVERVSLPYLLLLVGVHPGCQNPDDESRFRPLAVACQRIDLLTDLADDLRAERPRLSGGPEDRAAHRARARADLDAAAGVLSEIPEELQPMMRAFLRLHALRLDAVDRRDAGLDRRPVRTPWVPASRVLAAAAREVRHG